MNAHSLDRQSLSMAEYASELAKDGTFVMPGASGIFWAGGEIASLMRLPSFYCATPTPAEVRQAIWQGRVAIISFLIEADKQHTPNAWLYTCRDASYSLSKLSKEARRDIRRAQRSLRIDSMDWTTLINQGFAAYSDTRSRVGLSDGTIQHFRSRFERFSRNPAHHVIGAWKGNDLLAFMTLIVVDDWVAIEGSFSNDANREQCPNNGLAHYVLDYFLVQRGFRTVSYGTSSIQEGNDRTGLHSYKTKVGFDAQPVHRAFLVHPLLRLFVNHLTLRAMNTALRFRPGDRRLLKAIGVLSFLLSKKKTADATETTSHEKASSSFPLSGVKKNQDITVTKLD